MGEIINLAATVDQYITVRACRPPCADQCGDCALCDRACPPNCRAGVKDGTGHVWLLLDRIPVAQMQALIDARQKVLALADLESALKSGTAPDPEQVEAANEGVRVLQETVLALFAREYPGIDQDALVEKLGLPGMLQVAASFLSRLAATSGPPATPQPALTTTNATPKQRRSSAK